jgi:hypothetical protein
MVTDILAVPNGRRVAFAGTRWQPARPLVSGKWEVMLPVGKTNDPFQEIAMSSSISPLAHVSGDSCTPADPANGGQPDKV